MKKAFSILLLSLLMTTSVFAQPINIGGEVMEIDTKTINNRTLVPLRIIAEKVGASVEYRDGIIVFTLDSGITETDSRVTKSVIVSMDVENGFYEAKYTDLIRDGRTSKLSFDETMDAKPQIIDGTTYVPLIYAVKDLGCKVTSVDGILTIEKAEMDWQTRSLK